MIFIIKNDKYNIQYDNILRCLVVTWHTVRILLVNCFFVAGIGRYVIGSNY